MSVDTLAFTVTVNRTQAVGQVTTRRLLEASVGVTKNLTDTVSLELVQAHTVRLS